MNSQQANQANASLQRPRLIIVMGVCGCGKSTIAERLAVAMDGIYLDGDDYHPTTNIAKMSRGEALTDKDRWPWLQHFAVSMAQQAGVVVGACSALKRSYRDCLNTAANESILFILLDGTKALIRTRMSARQDHFMPDSLINSQFATLEYPQTDECAISIDINKPANEIVQTIQNHYSSSSSNLLSTVVSTMERD